MHHSVVGSPCAIVRTRLPGSACKAVSSLVRPVTLELSPFPAPAPPLSDYPPVHEAAAEALALARAAVSAATEASRLSLAEGVLKPGRANEQSSPSSLLGFASTAGDNRRTIIVNGANCSHESVRPSPAAATLATPSPEAPSTAARPTSVCAACVANVRSSPVQSAATTSRPVVVKSNKRAMKLKSFSRSNSSQTRLPSEINEKLGSPLMDDPFSVLFNGGGSARLLSAAEEKQLSRGVQRLVKLERVRESLEEQLQRPPSSAEWAAMVGLDEAKLSRMLKWGRECRQLMAASNMRLVVSVVKKYTTRGLALEELMTAGCVGLHKAIDKFDHQKGFKFSTYAHWWITQAVNRSCSEQLRVVRIPNHATELVSRVRKARSMLTDALGQVPAESDVAEVVGLSSRKLRELLRSVKTPMSMERPRGKGGDDDEETMGSLVEDHTLDSPEDAIARNLLKQDLDNVLHTLSEREREVIRLRYGLDMCRRVRTLEEVGTLFGVSRERVRQIEARALNKLRQPGRSEVLQAYSESL